jgi:hypothetical protein
MFRKFLLTAAVAVAAGLIAPSAARADFTVQLSSGLTAPVSIDFTTTPNGSAGGLSWSFNNITQQETVSGSYAGYGISLGISTNAPTTPALVTQSDLTIVNSGAAKASLVVTVSSSPFIFGTTTVLAVDSIAASSLTGGSLSSATTTVSGGSGSGTTSPIGLTSPLPLGGSAASGTIAVAIGASPATVSDTITIGDATGRDSFSFTSDVTATPAPSGLILAATIVPFFGLLRRRLRQTVAPVVA